MTRRLKVIALFAAGLFIFFMTLKIIEGYLNPVMESFIATNEIKIEPPPLAQRQITVVVNDPRIMENPIFKFRAEAMTLSDVLSNIGQLEKSQTLALRCEGGYNKQPPLYALDFDILRGDGGQTILQGMDISVTMHDVCMKKARAHIDYLRQYAPNELKHFR